MTDERRIVWVAVAQGRGHLMRAHLIRQLLQPLGVAVDVATTTPEGGEFLAALGTPSTVLGHSCGLRYDTSQNLEWTRSQREMLRYLGRHGLRDLRSLQRLAEGAALVVNDTLHPALLLGAWLGDRTPPVVNVVGTSTLAAVESAVANAAPRVVSKAARRGFRRLLHREHGRIEYRLGTAPQRLGPTQWRLPPLVAMARVPAAEMRRRLGIGGDKLAVVYLNPYFRDPNVAEAIERTLRGRGYWVVGVAEGLPSRADWLRRSRDLADLIGACDLFVSPPGVASATQALAAGVPWVALVTDQPEQRRNLALLRESGLEPPTAAVGPELGREIASALRGFDGRPDAHGGLETIEAAWTDALHDLATSPARRAA